MAELWLPSAGVNRKQKQLWLPNGGVSRKLKELYVGVGGVNRKVFSSLQYSFAFGSDTPNWMDNLGGSMASDGSGNIHGYFVEYSSRDALPKYWFDLNFDPPLSVSSGATLFNMDYKIFNELGLFALWDSSDYLKITITGVGFSAEQNILTGYEPFGAGESWRSYAYVLPTAQQITSIRITLKARVQEDKKLPDELERHLTLSWVSGGIKVLGQPIITGPTGYL